MIRQDLSPTALTGTGYKRAKATEAISQTKVEKARLALAVTVTKAYYGLVIAQRKYATAQQGLDQANHFVALGQSLERGGRKPHSDVVKFQLQQTAQEKSFREAKLAIENARLDLAVLLFRDFEQANVELSAAQRQLAKNLHAAYNETQTALAHIDSLQHAVDLAAENLRLNIPRYHTDEATALELVDAHNNLTQARNALDDGELRYRVAVANFQSFTGSF